MHKRIKQLKKWMFPSLLIMIVFSVLVFQLIFPAGASDRFFAGEAEEYYQDLQKLGFPEDYAAALTELHLLHPNWTFTPLLVTQEESQYTWNYVIDKEHEKAYNNIIYSSDTYSAYHHPTNKELYDSGHYQVSREALEYFMDPRNFLNETDIFQFYSLSGSTSNAECSVKAILSGTFMENAMLENGMTYAQYFVQLGEELDINPIFLATKVRQEQGVAGASPLISGKCGDKLAELADSIQYDEDELLAYNGYYNYFNINATGNGTFQIYLNAMKYAKEKGTSAMADEWSEGGAWNTRWKALYGGAYFLMNSYIGRYQSTVYLQKFNVDSRATNNFAHQYMATVHGAMSEARMLFQSFSTMNLLDDEANFLIPVYEGMPLSPCPDPAAGACNQTAQATARYEYHTEISDPIRYSASTSPIYLEAQLYSGESLAISGSVTHKYNIEGMYYAWDGGEWNKASDGNTIQTSFLCDATENTTHILVIRGTASYQTAAKDALRTNFLYAVIYVHVIARPNVNVTYYDGEKMTRETYLYGSRITLPQSQNADFIGWKGSDGTFLPSDAEIELLEDLSFSAVCWDYRQLEGAALVNYENMPRLRFSAVMRKEDYEFLSELSDSDFSYQVSLQDNGQATTLILSEAGTSFLLEDEEWVRLDALTAPLKQDAYETNYSASFYATVRYTNGTTALLPASGLPSERSAKDVATASLADKTVAYSQTLLTLLHSIAEHD